MTDVSCIGFYYHPRLPEAKEFAERAAEQLRGQVPQVWISEPWDAEQSERHLPRTDLLICIGGDGTVLRAARAASHHDVQILGVDMGRQAFLTELTPEQLEAHLPALLAGDYGVEERSMLDARPQDAAEDAPDRDARAQRRDARPRQPRPARLPRRPRQRRPDRRGPRRCDRRRQRHRQHRLLALRAAARSCTRARGASCSPPSHRISLRPPRSCCPPTP